MNDCFAINGNGGCGALRFACTGREKCAFYKSAVKQKSDLAAKYARLRSLSEEQQLYIATTYYGGKKVWDGDAPNEQRI